MTADERTIKALAAAGLLRDDRWVHVSCAGYTAPDMFEAFSAGIRWLADRVEIVDGEIDMPSDDQPGTVGMDHREACGDWLNDYDADTGRVNDDGEYVRPQLRDDRGQAVIDAAIVDHDLGTVEAHQALRRAVRRLIDARRAANGSGR